MDKAIESAASQVREAASNLSTGLQNRIEQAKDRLSDAQTAVRDRTEQATYAARRYVVANPWKSLAASLAVAGSIGVIVGLLIGRR